MQTKLNNDNSQATAQQGEVIAFYGDLVSINPKDVDFRGSATEDTVVLSYVKAYQDNQNFTIMYAGDRSGGLSDGLSEKITAINPHTQFVQINTIEEFSEYYDNGSQTMDRELHPVESVTNLARQDTLFYDVKEKEPQIATNPMEIKREYIKASDIGYNEMVKDLSTQINSITDLRKNPQEFLDQMGLEGYDAIKDSAMIDIAKIQLRNEFIKDYTLPQAGKTAVESIEKVIPGMPAKNIKEGVQDAFEFVHDMVGDTDRGNLRIEYDCKSLSECHIKGVYREYEDEKVLEKTEENNTSREGMVSENNTTKPMDEIAFVNQQTEQTQTIDTTLKAQEIVANMDLPQRDEGVDYGMEID